MQSTRRGRLEAVLQKELSEMIPRSVKDPRVVPLTITSIQVAPDGSHATVFISILGSTLQHESNSPYRMSDCLKGLQSAQGYLRRKLARALKIKNIPELSFREDRGIANVSRVFELLKQIEKSGS